MVANLNLIDKDYYRAQIGWCDAKQLLFSRTVAENIALESNPDRRRIVEVARLARRPRFHQQAAARLRTDRGRAGVGLSAVTQRLCIARLPYTGTLGC